MSDDLDVAYSGHSRVIHLVCAPESEHRTLCGITVPKFLDGHAESPVWETGPVMEYPRHSAPWRDLQDAVTNRVNCQRCLKAWGKRVTK